jgi:hypothetical protein
MTNSAPLRVASRVTVGGTYGVTVGVSGRVAVRWLTKERWVSFVTGIVTPLTLITALLFYSGYVSARSQYEYFGIDVDTIGLSTQDFVMRHPQPLLVPLLVLSLLAVAGLLLHNAIQPRAGLVGVRRARLAVIVVLALGVLGLFLYPVLGGLAYYAVVVPRW